MTESPRWLYTKNKTQEFNKLFHKIAKTNGVTKARAEQLLRAFHEDSVS